DADLVSGGSSTGSIVIGSAGMLTLQAGADSLQTLQFATGGTQEILALATPTAVQATIDNFASGRTIDLLDTAVTGFQYGGTTLDVLETARPSRCSICRGHSSPTASLTARIWAPARSSPWPRHASLPARVLPPRAV